MEAARPTPLKLNALCLRSGDFHLIAQGEAAGALGLSLFGPPVFLHFALRTAVGGDALVPAQVLDDWGRPVPGGEVYGWIESRAYAFPRADVFGLGLDGSPRSFFMKELDLELPPFAFAARTADDFPGQPIDLALDLAASPGRLLLAPADSFPVQLLRAVPAYRLDPALVGPVGASLVARILSTGARNLRLTADDLDDALEL